MRITSTSLAAAAFAALLLPVAACGGGAKLTSGLGDKTPGPPPGQDGAGGKEPDRVISKDARADYNSAADYFAKQEAAGWSSSSCESAAEKFKDVADDHKELIEARYMQGLAYHRCGMAAPAEAAYLATLSANPNHAQSTSNIGELYFAAGKRDKAKEYWEKAIKVYPKIVAARVNLASMMLDELRQTKEGDEWKRIEKAARDQLSFSLAVDSDNVRAFTTYALVYMEGRQKNKNRLDLAKVLLDEGSKRSDKYAPLKNAFGLYHLARNNLTAALEQFQQAVKLDPKFVEARMNVGLLNLGVRKFEESKAQFSAIVELDPKNYDAYIGLGIAQRGLGNFDDSEAQYKKARGVDGKRGDATFNLGVLYKDFRAGKQADLKATQAAYKTALGYFREFVAIPGVAADDKAEADNNIKDCEKMIAQLEDFIKMSEPGAGG